MATQQLRRHLLYLRAVLSLISLLYLYIWFKRVAEAYCAQIWGPRQTYPPLTKPTQLVDVIYALGLRKTYPPLTKPTQLVDVIYALGQVVKPVGYFFLGFFCGVCGCFVYWSLDIRGLGPKVKELVADKMNLNEGEDGGNLKDVLEDQGMVNEGLREDDDQSDVYREGDVQSSDDENHGSNGGDEEGDVSDFELVEIDPRSESALMA